MKNVNVKQRIVLAIIIPLVIIPIALRIAIEVHGYDPFEWEETWLVWVITFALIGFIEYRIFGTKETHKNKQ